MLLELQYPVGLS